jgi:hypothetical protein
MGFEFRPVKSTIVQRRAAGGAAIKGKVHAGIVKFRSDNSILDIIETQRVVHALRQHAVENVVAEGTIVAASIRACGTINPNRISHIPQFIVIVITNSFSRTAPRSG